MCTHADHIHVGARKNVSVPKGCVDSFTASVYWAVYLSSEEHTRTVCLRSEQFQLRAEPLCNGPLAFAGIGGSKGGAHAGPTTGDGHAKRAD